MTDKELDDLFQKTFSGHQMPVPPDMWDRVNPQKEKRRRGAFLWWSGLGVAALFLLIGGAAWLYHTSPEKTFISAKSTDVHQPESSAKKKAIPPARPDRMMDKTKMDKPNLPGSAAADNLSFSKKAQVNSRYDNGLQDFYNKKHNGRSHLSATFNEQVSATGKEGGNGKNIQNSNEASGSKNGDSVEEAISSGEITGVVSNQPAASVQKPDSADVSTGKPAKQDSKAAAVKVKKIHGEKAAGLELMIAGYGNNRDIYGVSQTNRAGLVTFGAMDTKEKLLIHSFGVNARISKPLTSHVSFKTGLQFLQTHQRVSYNYETISQTVLVSSLNADTTRSARLRSERPVVKGVYNSISVPLLISYHTEEKNLNLGATAGVMVNVLSWYKGQVPDAGYKQTVAAKNTFRSNTGTSLYAGITAAKNLGSYQLFAEPHVQYTLSSITKNSASFRQKITGYGIGIGIRKTLGK